MPSTLESLAARPGYLFVRSDQGAGETTVLNLGLDRDGPAMLEEDRERPFAFNLGSYQSSECTPEEIRATATEMWSR